MAGSNGGQWEHLHGGGNAHTNYHFLPLQPSFDIFQSFDELLLLKQGGVTVYFGPRGEAGCERRVDYFQGIHSVQPCPLRYNPANW